MDGKQLKALAEKFRGIADDPAAVKALAESSCKAQPADQQCADLCNRLRNAADGDEVRAICDEVKAK